MACGIFKFKDAHICLERQTRLAFIHLTFFILIPSIAQLVERWTVEFIQVIHRSLVQIRLEGFIYSNNPRLVTNGLSLMVQVCYLR